MRTLHLVAYACEPNKGSEPGAGWNILKEATQYFPKVVVYTRANNAGAIRTTFGSQVEIVPVRLPEFAERWKKGQRRVRSYYMLWQLATRRQLRRRLRGEPPAVVHHATFATVTIPPLSLLGSREGDTVILGPVGGLVRVPMRVLRRHFPVGPELLRELLRDAAVWTTTRNPLLRAALARCDQIFVQSDIDGKRINRIVAVETAVLTNSGFDDPETPFAAAAVIPGRLVFAGDLKYAKGVMLLPELMRRLPGHFHLNVYGDGPARRDLESAILDCGVADRVHLAGRVAQEEVRHALARAETMVLPSFREGAPAIVSEAIQAGCRVVALDVGGISSIFSSIATGVRLVAVTSPDVIGELSLALAEVANENVDAMVETWGEKGRRLYASSARLGSSS